MTDAEKLYHKIGEEIPDAKEGKMFGALCLKAPNGKAGVMFWKEYMIFKLPEDDLNKALELKDAQMFTPMEGRAMNGWVQLSYEHKGMWKELAELAMDYVKQIKK